MSNEDLLRMAIISSAEFAAGARSGLRCEAFVSHLTGYLSAGAPGLSKLIDHATLPNLLKGQAQ